MQISLEVIHEQLAEKFPEMRMGIGLGTAGKMYPFPELCQADGTLHSGHFYLFQEKDWSEDITFPDDVAIISIGEPHAGYTGTCLIFPSNTSALEIYSAICDVYVSFLRLRTDLEQCIRQSSSLQELVVLIGQWTRNPVTISDVDHVILAYYMQDMAYASLSRGTPMGKHVPISWLSNIDMIEKKENEERVFSSHSVVNDRECDSCFVVFYQDGFPIASATISSYEMPLRETDYFLLSLSAPFIKQALLKNKPLNSISLFTIRNAFYDILQDSALNKHRIRRYLQQNGMKTTDRYACVVMQLNWTLNLKIPVDYICSQIQKRLKQGCCFSFDSNIVAFTNLDSLSEELDTIIARFQVLLTKYQFKAGVSNIFTDVFQAKTYYTQALAALESGNAKAPKEQLYYFNDYALDHFIRYGTTRLPGRSICSYHLLQLEKHDQETGTEYVNTLRTFFEYEMSSTKAAQALYIHRSTFLYRLERIQNIFHLDWTDSRKRLYLLLSLELL